MSGVRCERIHVQLCHGTQIERFRSVALSESDLATLGVREVGGEYGDRQ